MNCRRSQLRNVLTTLVACAAGACVLASPAGASTVIGLTTEAPPRVFTVDSEAPSTLLTSVSVSGLSAGEVILGMDVRPKDGALYVLTRDVGGVGRLRKLDPYTGAVAAAVNLGAALAVATGWDVDFDPANDQLRVVNGNDDNLRVHPDTGTVTNETALAYALGDPKAGGPSPLIAGIAYPSSFAGAVFSSAYAYDWQIDWIDVLGTPSTGQLASKPSGSGINTDSSDEVGFDALAVGDPAGTVVSTVFASVSAFSGGSGVSTLYLPSVFSGVFSTVGPIGPGGGVKVADIAARPNVVSARNTSAVAAEGTGGDAVFTLLRQDALGASSVNWSVTPGTATAADLGATSGTVTFATGATAATLAIPITDDALDEPAETFALTLAPVATSSGMTPLLTPSARQTLTVTLGDNDVTVVPPVVPTPPTPDTTKPFVFVLPLTALKRTALAKTGLRTTLVVSEQSTGTLQLKLGKAVLGSGGFATTGPAAPVAKLKLSKAGAAALAKAFAKPTVKKLTLSLAISVKDTAGNVTVSTKPQVVNR